MKKQSENSAFSHALRLCENFFLIGAMTALLLLMPAFGASGADDLLGQAVKGFRYPDYDSQGQLKMEIAGDKAHFLPQDLIQITNLRMTFYEEGKMVMHVSTPLCFFDRVKRTAVSTSEARVTRAEIIITGRGFNWNEKDGLIRINNHARVILQKPGQKSYLENAPSYSGAEPVAGSKAADNDPGSAVAPSVAQGAMEDGQSATRLGGASGEARVAERGARNDTNCTVITSSKLTFDQKKSMVVFEGNVVVTDPALKIASDRLTVLLSNDKKVELIKAEGNVVITRDIIQATSQMAWYAIPDGKITLSGKPCVTRQRDNLTAETIVLWRNSNRIICEPHAHLIMYSDQKTQGQLIMP